MPLLPSSQPERALTTDERRARLTALGLWPLAAIGLLVLTAVPYDICLFHHWTEIPCPLCGGTRATWALLHGSPAAASALFPLLLPLAALALVHTGTALAEIASNQRLISSRWFTTAWGLLGGGIVLAWLVRLVLLAV